MAITFLPIQGLQQSKRNGSNALKQGTVQTEFLQFKAFQNLGKKKVPLHICAL